MRRGKQIGILPHNQHRAVAVIPVKTDRQYRSQTEGADELHESAHTALTAKGFRQLGSFLQADSLDLRDFLRRVFEDFKRFVPETIDQQQCCRRSDPAHGASSQVVVYGRSGRRQHTLGVLSLKLPSVDAVCRPNAGYNHRFASCGIGKAADDRDELAVGVDKSEHGVAVFLIFIDDGIDRASKLYQLGFLIHFLTPL